MTTEEVKRRLRFVAEWWEPEILVVNDPGCILQVACDDHPGVSPVLMHSHKLCDITSAWDRCDREAALRAIEEL